MGRWIGSYCVLLVVLASWAGIARAAEPLTGQQVEYSFDRPSISTVTIAGESYDRVTMPGVPNCGNVGEPALPASGARILLPFGTEVSGTLPLGNGFGV